MFPLHNFQKYLAKEISTEEYRNTILLELIQRVIIFDLLNLGCFAILSQNWAADGTLKVPLWQELLMMLGVYIVVAGIFHLIEYSDTKKIANFLVSVREEDDLMPKSKNSMPTEKFPNKTPRTMGKLYLKDKISKLEYVKSFFEFKLKFLRGVFICVFIFIFCIFLSLKDGIITNLSASYLIAFFTAWVIKMKMLGFMNIGLYQTLQQKNTQQSAFDQAENISKLKN